MARFRSTMTGNRGQISRLGSKNSGIVADVNGWNSGVRVSASVDSEDKDEFTIYLTSGSYCRTPSRHIGDVVLTVDGPRFTPA